MPDPICSATPDPDLSTNYPATEELSCTAPEVAPNQSLPSEPPAECTSASGASALASKFGQKDYSAVIANASTAPAPSSAARLSYFDPTLVRDSQGFTAGFTVVEGRDPGLSLDELYGSVQGGAQNTVQAGAMHEAGTGQVFGVNVGCNVDILNAKVNLGAHNDDGSTGGNIGAMATAGGVEITAEHSGWSGTLGWSVSAGVAVSSGTRDIDHDGKPETCFKAAIGPFTVGACTEF